MKLSEIMKRVCDTGDLDFEVSCVTADSRQIVKDCVFICIKGQKFDGHDHAKEAVEAGARAVVVEHDVGLDCQILVENTRNAYALMSAAFFGYPAEKMKIIGVTGTNGKTTITNILKHMLEDLGHKVGLIGTIQNEIGDMTIPAKHMTPDPGELHALFARMAKAGCEYVVMEASSHALDQHRLDGIQFASAIFTNLTQDHLDYHGTMENYFQAKAKLFSMTDSAVINYDDEYGKRLDDMVCCRKLTFSTHDNNADYTARTITYRPDGVDFTIVGNLTIARVHFCMPGEFSVANALAAVACIVSLGFDLKAAARVVDSFTGVRGRSEVIETGEDYTIVCDYAHTPDGLEQMLAAMEKIKTGRLVVLFGCAGNRDRTKRPKMVESVAKHADFVILTSDNPRDEDPMRIIEDALPGFEKYKTPHVVMPDRYEAIYYALTHAQKDDLIILAGKGHEDYQVLHDATIFFDERKIVEEMLERIRMERKLKK